MARWFSFRGKNLLIVLGALLLLAGFAWWERSPLLAWYYVRGLAAAGEEDRETWVARVASLDSATLPNLLACLRRDNPQVSANARVALARLVESWGNDPPRRLELAQQLAEGFPGFSVSGQQDALDLMTNLIKGQRRPGGTLVPAASRMLAASVQAKEAGVQARALELAEVLTTSASGLPPESLRELVRAGLKNPEPTCRLRAVNLLMHETLRADNELRTEVVPLLHAPEAPVRRAALLAVGMAQETISEDALLPLLHDPDADIRRLCEQALRGRGLREDHLRLARLISDSRPAVRLEVLETLMAATDLEPGAWLRRMSMDPAPAVRAAAVRAAAAQTQVNLGERLRELAQDDPSPTVRQLAQHYGEQHRQALAAKP